uniref:FD-like protein 1-II n=1 Tax=Platanus acerifolia TaxID=140101 RepID=A0A4D6KA07_PLAAC|nr:FD-like protein 1-II [Platanus x hispanica]
MWSSRGGGEDNLNTHKSNGVSSSSSKSTSTSSSFSPLTTSSLLPNPRRRTMEEVWKDISLASLNENSNREELLLPPKNTTTTTFRGTILQDFLARPFNKDHHPTNVVSATPSTSGDVTLFGSPPLAPPPATALSLNSGPEFQYLDNTDPLRPHPQLHNHVNAASPCFVSSINSPFDAFSSSSGLSSFCKRRVPDFDDSCADRRHKRMIKNRESAARSRARKQESLSPLLTFLIWKLLY